MTEHKQSENCCECCILAAQQRPVAWKWRYKNGELSVASFDTRAQCERNSDDTAGEAVPLYTQPQPPVQQEPVGAQARFNDGETVTEWKSCSIERHNLVQSNRRFFSKYETRLIYTAPQPARQPLTDEQIVAVANKSRAAEAGDAGYILPISFARAIEEAHGITGGQQ